MRWLVGLSGAVVVGIGLHAVGLLWVLVALAGAFAPFALIAQQAIEGEPLPPRRR
jgi:hypothetical protein